jgi:hypothetical protein
MTPDQVIKPIVVLFVVFVMFLAISRGGRRQAR